MQSCSHSQENRFVSDEELVLLANNGHTDAFNSLILRYVFVVNLRASCYRGTGIEPEDLAQEGMIGLLGAVRAYRPGTGASFRTFAWLCIDRSVISAVRSTYRKKQIPKSCRVSYIGDSPGQELYDRLSLDTEFDPECMVIAQEDLLRFWEKTSRILSVFERKVLISYLSVDNYKEIAVQLGTTVKAVDNALQRVRRKLK